MKYLLIASLTLGVCLPVQAASRNCPKDFEPMVGLLLKDLPAYANRISVRAHKRTELSDLSTIVLAGRPEFEPLPLESNDPTVKQLFFTTLERQTTAKKRFDQQHYHWLLLTDTRYGWRMVSLYTRYGRSDGNAQPPRETSQAELGQGIALWLRDCQAASILGKSPVP